MLEEFVNNANNLKSLYTAGPSSLTIESLESLQPCFGRGDATYNDIENIVLKKLLALSGQEKIVRLQGSATLALEIALNNFCKGKILVINTGYYSNRIINILNLIKNHDNRVFTIDQVDYKKINSIKGNYDWIIACYTETSIGFKLEIELLAFLSNKLNSKLFLDATASIGLENKHDLADVCCFSSCKGLFGLTGASFITYNSCLEINEPKNSHYLRLSTHINKGVTGPYHTILSLHGILENYKNLRARVLKWQSVFTDYFSSHLIYPKQNQPILCTAINSNIKYLKQNPVIYTPRSNTVKSIVCHIGQVHQPVEYINTDSISKHFQISDS